MSKEIGTLGKYALHQYTDYQCDRQLYYFLFGDSSAHVGRELNLDNYEGRADVQELLKTRGKEFEQRVYRQLDLNFREACIREINAATREVKATRMNEAYLRALHEDFTREGSGTAEIKVLCEHSFPILSGFTSRIFGLSEDATPPTTRDQSNRSARPDLLIVGHRAGSDHESWTELCADGSERLLTLEERTVRIGVNVWDIKHVNPTRIKNGYLAELVYYALALSYWLAEVGLDELFFVRADGHAILGKAEAEEQLELNAASLAQLRLPASIRALSRDTRWRDSQRLFERAQAASRRSLEIRESGGGSTGPRRGYRAVAVSVRSSKTALSITSGAMTAQAPLSGLSSSSPGSPPRAALSSSLMGLRPSVT